MPASPDGSSDFGEISAVAFAALFVRELPPTIRYIKMERM